MAFWFKAGSNPGSSRQVEFIMDSDSDKSKLPTSSAPGTQQDTDDVINLPVGKGSMAFSIATGKIFMLNSSDTWVEVG